MKARLLDRLQAVLGGLDGKRPPIGLLVWLGLGVALAAVAVLALGQHTTTSRPVAAASRSTTSTTSTTTSRRLTTSTTTKPPPTTTTAPKAKPPPPPTPGHPVPYARLGQHVAQRLEATLGGLDVAITTPTRGASPTIGQSFVGGTAFGVDVSDVGAGAGVVRIDGAPGATVAVAVPPGACGVAWRATTVANAALPAGATIVTVIWSDPKFPPGASVVGGRLVVSLDTGATLAFASSCPAGTATYATPFLDPWWPA